MSRIILKSGWIWHMSAPKSILEPWFRNYRELEKNPVKKNPVRTVFRAQDGDGNLYYVKHDVPIGFQAGFKALFRRKIRSEYRSGLLLRKLEIPCVEFAGFGEKLPEAMLISKALSGYISALEFWFGTSTESDISVRDVFLEKLVNLVSVLLQNHVVHPDFHAGNLMVTPDGQHLALVDLYGIRQVRKLTCLQKKQLLHIFTEFTGEITRERYLQAIKECGAESDPEKAVSLADELIADAQGHVMAEWERRKQQILSGNSKFCRTIRLPDGSAVVIRNTRWFAPKAFQRENMEEVICPEAEGERLWTESFLQELLHAPPGPRPSGICYQRKEGNTVLFYKKVQKEAVKP